MKRAILIVLGMLLLLIATPLLVGGAALAAWASGDDPTVEGRIGRVESPGYAVVSDRIEVDWQWPLAERWDVTIAVEGTDSDVPVFFGYGPADLVDAYLAGSPHTLVYSIGTGEVEVAGDVDIPGTQTPQPPGEQQFWVADASGFGRQEIELAPDRGDYRFVAMNADATPGVSMTVYGSMQLPFLFGVGIGLVVFGGLLAILGVVLLVLGIRMASEKPAAPHYAGAGYPGGTATPYQGYEQWYGQQGAGQPAAGQQGAWSPPTGQQGASQPPAGTHQVPPPVQQPAAPAPDAPAPASGDAVPPPAEQPPDRPDGSTTFGEQPPPGERP